MTTMMLSLAALLWKAWVMQRGVNWLRATPRDPEAMPFGTALSTVLLFSLVGTLIGGLAFFGPLFTGMLWAVYALAWLVVVGGFFRLGLLRSLALIVLLWAGQHAFTLGVKLLEWLVGAEGYQAPFYGLY